MESMLLALALTTCIEQPNFCTTKDTETYKLITVCNLAPDIEKSSAQIEATINARKHLFVFESRCELF